MWHIQRRFMRGILLHPNNLIHLLQQQTLLVFCFSKPSTKEPVQSDGMGSLPAPLMTIHHSYDTLGLHVYKAFSNGASQRTIDLQGQRL